MNENRKFYKTEGNEIGAYRYIAKKNDNDFIFDKKNLHKIKKIISENDLENTNANNFFDRNINVNINSPKVECIDIFDCTNLNSPKKECIEMIESSRRNIYTPDIKAVESDIPAIDLTNSLKNDSNTNLKGFDKNLNINLDRRYFTEYDTKEKVHYKKVDSCETQNIKPIKKDKEIQISEGTNKMSEDIENNNHYENGRY